MIERTLEPLDVCEVDVYGLQGRGTGTRRVVILKREHCGNFVAVDERGSLYSISPKGLQVGYREDGTATGHFKLLTGKPLRYYSIKFNGRESGAIGTFSEFEGWFIADSQLAAERTCLQDTRYELNGLVEVTTAPIMWMIGRDGLDPRGVQMDEWERESFEFQGDLFKAMLKKAEGMF